ncbi:MAG: ubiquitin-like domain-containing protein [Propionibacteriaceae bacterium]
MRKVIPAAIAGVAALAVAGGAFGYSAVHKDVTVAVDGQKTQVSTLSGSVADVLSQQGITVGEHDLVAPAADAAVTDGQLISVQYGRQVTLDVDGATKSFWTTARDVNSALAAVGLQSEGAKLSTSRSAPIGRQGLAIDVNTLKTVSVKAGGKTTKVQTTGATVADALAAAKITPDGDDLLSPKRATVIKDGSRVTFVKVDKKKVTKKTAVDFDVVRKNTSKLSKGTTKVDTTGRNGTRTTTYVETRYDGKLKSSKKGASTITTEPRTKIVLVGTKVRPAAPKKSTSSSRSSSSSSSRTKSSGGSPSVASGSVWDKIAQCESGGNWSINTGNGFYGGLQFTLSTWHGYGGSGMPNNASRQAQIAVAKRVQAAQGWGAWPACTAKLGIG